MDAVKDGQDIPDYLIPKICKDKVFLMICEACQHVGKRAREHDIDDDGWCHDCGDYHDEEE